MIIIETNNNNDDVIKKITNNCGSIEIINMNKYRKINKNNVMD